MATLECPVHTTAKANPDEVALAWKDGQLSYDLLDQRIEAVRLRLENEGVGPADRIAIVALNSWQFIVVLQAIFRLGAVAVPISTRFTEDTILSLYTSLGCKLCLVDRLAIAGISQQIYIQDLVAPDSPKATIQSAEINGAADATILFSSGSTGLPKAILHAWQSHYYNALGSNENIHLQAGDRWLLSLPLYHVAGLAVLFRCFIAGATVVVQEAGFLLSDALVEAKITHVSMLSTTLKAPSYDA